MPLRASTRRASVGIVQNGFVLSRLSVAVGGTGPTVVLLHGWPQTGRAWRRVPPALARDHIVVVPDLRGTGASERPDTGYAKPTRPSLGRQGGEPAAQFVAVEDPGGVILC